MENKSIIGIIVAIVAIVLVGIFIGKGGNKEEVNEVAFNPVLENLVDGSYEFTSGTIGWSASKTGGSHTGTVDVKSGVVVVKDGKVVSTEMVADLNTIKNTDGGAINQKLIDHLKSPDFFNVEAYPTAVVTVASLMPSGRVNLARVDKQGKFGIETNVPLEKLEAKQLTPTTVSVSSSLTVPNSDIDIGQSTALKTMLKGDFQVSLDGVFTLKK